MPKPNITCVICNKPIYRIPSRINGYNTCSLACRNKYYSGEKFSREARLRISSMTKDRLKDPTANPFYIDGRTFNNKCSCGKAINYGSKYCKDCLKASKIGENNPAWKGGIARSGYGPEFNRFLKSWVKNRDRNRCFKCDSEEGLVVHHIDYNKLNNNSNNLITVCWKCHGRLGTNRKFFAEYIKNRENRRLSIYEWNEHEVFVR